MLCTTRRNAGVQERRGARALAAVLSAKYAARGKKAVPDLAAFARKNGHRSIMVVERGTLAFVFVNAEGWEWAPETVSMRAYSFYPDKCRMPGLGIFSGKDGEIFSGLFREDGYLGGAHSVSADGKTLLVKCGGKNALSMDYEIKKDGASHED
jgi:hypothetical protein